MARSFVSATRCCVSSLLLGLLACEATPPQGEVAPAAWDWPEAPVGAPPYVINLTGPPTALPGDVLRIEAELPPEFPDGLRVYLMRSQLLGEGPCPAYLRGDCWDLRAPFFEAFTPGVGGLAVFEVEVPADYEPLEIHFQAAVNGRRQAVTSNTVTVPLTGAPDDDVPFCEPGVEDGCIDPAGLVLWLRAEDLAAEGLGEGDQVAQWPDASGFGLEASQADVDRQPRWSADAVGGRPAVRFDGVDDFLELNLNLLASTEDSYTLAAVILPEALDNAHLVGTGTSERDDTYHRTFGNGLALAAGAPLAKANWDDVGLRAEGTPLTRGEAAVLVADVSPRGARLYVNGVRVAADAGLPNAYPYTKTTLGGSDGLVGDVRDLFTGLIAEVLLFDEPLGSADREALEYALGQRFGAPVAAAPGCDGSPGTGRFIDACGVVCGRGDTCPATLAESPTLWIRPAELEVADGQPVDVWFDGAAAADAEQRDPARRPQQVVTEAGPAVRFDGVDDRLDLSAHVFGNAALPLTLFAVVRNGDTAGHLAGTATSEVGAYLETFGNGLVVSDGGIPGGKAINAGSGTFLQGTEHPILDDDLHLLTLVLTSGGTRLYVDGELAATSVAATNGYPYTRSTLGASDGVAVGASRDPWAGDLYELIVVPGAKGACSRPQIEDELAARYGLTLGVGSDPAVPSPVLELAADDLDLLPGGAVAAWSSLAPASVSASQSTVAKQPTLATLGSAPVVRFDGVDDRLDLSDNLFGLGRYPLTVLAVMASTDLQGHVIGTGSSSAGYFSTYGGALTLNGGAAMIKANNAGVGLNLGAPDASNDGALHQYSAVFSSSGSFLRLDGEEVARATTALNAYPYLRSTLGSSDGLASNASRDPFAGDIAHLVVFPAALERCALEAEERALAERWGTP